MSFLGLENHFNEANQDVRGFVEAKVSHLELKIFKKTVQLSTWIIRVVLIGFFALFFLMILSFGIAFIIGEQLGNMSYGFFIVAGIYLLVVLILLLFGRRMLSSGVVRKLSKELTDLK